MRHWFSTRFRTLLAKAWCLGTALGVFASVALAACAVAGSFLIHTKPLGVGIAAVGCFAAGWLFSSFFVRLKESETPSLQDELERKRREVMAAKEQIAALETDNARLRHQRIDINAFAPVLKLGLAEADMKIKDVKIAWMNDFDSGGMLSKPTRSKYVGVLERSFKAVYGVDLMKLKILEDGDCLRVAGISPESIGLKDDSKRWLVRQTQKYRLKSSSLAKGAPIPANDPETGWGDGETYFQIDTSAPFEGRTDLNVTMSTAEAQEEELQQRVNNGIGQEFQLVNEYIQKTAQGFITLLLAPVKKPILFVSTPLAELEGQSDWLALEDFAKNFNKQLEAE